MAFLAQLWLPIVVSALLVFFVSAATHMLVPYRLREWGRVEGQDAIRAALQGVAPGLYAFPLPVDAKDRGKPEELARWSAGPSGWISLVPSAPFSMGRNLGLSLVVNLLVSAVAAYLASRSLTGPYHYGTVFRLVGTVGFVAYAVGPAYEAIWYWKPWKSIAMGTIDALLYGAVMAGSFGWLWPR
jgi:hypothetical protein